MGSHCSCLEWKEMILVACARSEIATLMAPFSGGGLVSPSRKLEKEEVVAKGAVETRVRAELVDWPDEETLEGLAVPEVKEVGWAASLKESSLPFFGMGGAGVVLNFSSSWSTEFLSRLHARGNREVHTSERRRSGVWVIASCNCSCGEDSVPLAGVGDDKEKGDGIIWGVRSGVLIFARWASEAWGVDGNFVAAAGDDDEVV